MNFCIYPLSLILIINVSCLSAQQLQTKQAAAAAASQSSTTASWEAAKGAAASAIAAASQQHKLKEQQRQALAQQQQQQQQQQRKIQPSGTSQGGIQMPNKPRLAPVAKPVGLDPVTILKERENRYDQVKAQYWH